MIEREKREKKDIEIRRYRDSGKERNRENIVAWEESGFIHTICKITIRKILLQRSDLHTFAHKTLHYATYHCKYVQNITLCYIHIIANICKTLCYTSLQISA